MEGLQELGDFVRMVWGVSQNQETNMQADWFPVVCCPYGNAGPRGPPILETGRLGGHGTVKYQALDVTNSSAPDIIP